jgi:predicted SpoU family rRNA methylase
MIYSRFGGEVEILWGDIKKGEVDIKFKDDGSTMKTYIYELRADDGINEIEKEIKKVMKIV